MKRGLRFVLVSALFATAAMGADDTEKVLNATHVNDVLRFTITQPDPKKPATISYTIDDRHSGILHDGDTFTSQGAVDLTYGDFNPLKISLASEQKSAPDPVQAAIDKFIADLIPATKGIVPAPPSAAELAAREFGQKQTVPVVQDCFDVAFNLRQAVYKAEYDKQMAEARKAAKPKVLKDAALLAAEKKAGDAAKDEAKLRVDDLLSLCAKCDDFAKRQANLETAVDAANKLKVTTATGAVVVNQETVQRWIDGATGRAGVVTTRTNVQDTFDQLAKLRKATAAAKAEADKLLQEMIAEPDDFNTKDQDLRGHKLSFDKLGFHDCVTATMLARVQSAGPALQAALDKIDALVDSLKKVLAVLMAYEQMRWRNGDRDVVFDTVQSDPALNITTKVTIKMLTYSFNEDKNTVDQKDDADAVNSFDIRRERRLVSEVGVAAVYNDLRYPKYSLDTDGNITKDFDTSNVDLAATMNFLCGSCIGNGIYPGFQFGMSKAKDYPGLLAGGVLRFGGTNRIAIASGVMVTWYKDLNALHVGDTTTQDKLDKDLKRRRSPAAWYLAVQYTFP